LDKVGRNPSKFFDIYKSEAMKNSALTSRTVGITEEFITKMLGLIPDLKAQTHKFEPSAQKEGGLSLSYVEDLDEDRSLRRYDQDQKKQGTVYWHEWPNEYHF
jgi:hypothetical protein